MGTDVHVEDVGLRGGDVVLGQHGLLGGVHAAEARAVGTADGLVARAHALDEDHALGLLAVGRTLDVAFGGARGGQQAFVLQGGDDVGVLAAAVLLVDGPVHEVVTGGGHDAAHFLGDDLVLHVVLDGAGGADLGAHAAFALGHLAAVFGIDDRLLGDGLREGDVDGRGGTGEFVEGVGRLLAGAFFRAGAAAGAQAPVHIGGALADLDGEVAHIAGDVFPFRHGVQGDVGMLGHVHHLGAQDAGRAVHGGEGLVQLGHSSADAGKFFYNIHFITCFRNIKGRLDSGNTSADDQCTLGNTAFACLKRSIQVYFCDCGSCKDHGL